jgi:putative resolvase
MLASGEVTDDLVGDVVEVLTSCCGRLYGRRSVRNRVHQGGGLRAA